MRAAVLLIAIGVTLLARGSAALADSPSPSPSMPPSPRPSPSATTSPTPTPTASTSAPASPSPSVSPTPTAPVVTDDMARVSGVPLDEIRHVIAATTLAERIDAERTLAAAERALLLAQVERIQADRARATARAADLSRRLEEQRAVLDRLIQQTYKVSQTSPLQVLLQRWSVIDVVVHADEMSTLSEKQHVAVDAIHSLESEARATLVDLARQQDEVARLSDAVAAKDAVLAQLAARADRLVAAAARGPQAVNDVEIDLLRSLADDAAREHQAEDALIAEIAHGAGVSLPEAPRWEWPLAGVVSQPFGPTPLELEPPATYHGVTYPHFHDGIDIAGAIGSPVTAAARGRVAFVGHIAGGAEVVIIAHADGLVSLYAHLDDTMSPPTVRPGDTVEAGERIGSVGLTGITTGPHLHFTVHRGAEPADPRTFLPSERPS